MNPIRYLRRLAAAVAGLAAHHGGLDADAVGQAAEGGVEGLPQPLPGVVVPELAQLGAGVPAFVPVTVGRHPRVQRDKHRVVLAGEAGRVAQRGHAGW